MSKVNWFDQEGKEYAAFRPRYPTDLLAWVASTAQHHQLLWDCATGNGQAACALADYFTAVIATDSAANQINSAQKHPRVQYRVATATQSGLDDQTVDCITIAQGLHWFAHDDFFQEARRVAKPGASIAAWTYATPIFEHPATNAVWTQCYADCLQAYFPPGREFVDAHYATIPFPFAERTTKTFCQVYHWSMTRFLQYVSTWSAVRNYRHKHSIDPIENVIKPRLLAVSADANQDYTLRFEMTVLQAVIG